MGEASSLLGHDLDTEGIELQDYDRKPASRPLPKCGGCDKGLGSDTEVTCPACDCPMHPDCGTPVETDDSPFRLCSDCDGSGTTTRMENPRIGMRRRASSVDLEQDALTGKKQVVSHLMSHKPAPQRKLSKPNLNDTPNWQKDSSLPDIDFLSFLGSDRSLYVYAGLMLCLVIIVVIQGINSPATQTEDDDSSNVQKAMLPASQNSNGAQFTILDTVATYQDAWWMADSADNYLSKIYVSEEFANKLVGLRDTESIAGDSFAHTCGQYRFDLEKFPKVSILIGPIYDGYPGNFLTMTLHSILARTPHQLISEILIVHDNSPIKSENDELDIEFKKLTDLSDFIKIIQPRSPNTPANRVTSRNKAMLEATSDYLVFVDPYVEVWSGTWLQQLLLPILEDPRTLSAAMVHEMNPKLERKNEGDTANYMYMIDEWFQLNRVHVDHNSEPSFPWKPYPTPFIDGHIFAVRKAEILNAMDGGLTFMDGDTVALGLKFWMCRARVIQVPCARVGFVPLTEFQEMPVPLTLIDGNGLSRQGDFLYRGKVADDRTKLAVKNYMRIIRIWLPDIADEWYKAAFGKLNLPEEWNQFAAGMNDNDKNMELMENLRDQCQNLEWFDKHVLMVQLGVHHPWYSGEVRN